VLCDIGEDLGVEHCEPRGDAVQLWCEFPIRIIRVNDQRQNLRWREAALANIASGEILLVSVMSPPEDLSARDVNRPVSSASLTPTSVISKFDAPGFPRRRRLR